MFLLDHGADPNLSNEHGVAARDLLEDESANEAGQYTRRRD